MTTSPVWYAGRCIKRPEHDKVVNLEVVARLDKGKWVLIENAQRLFGGTREVELRCNHAKAVKLGEWEMFMLSKKGRKLWIVGEHRKLHYYADLANLGGAEQVQRYLAAEELRTSELSGSWMLRSLETEILQVDLRQVQGVAQISSSSGKIAAFPFDADSVVCMPVEGGEISLYDLRGDGEPISIYDWSSDEAYALRIARAIADTTDPRAKKTIAWLEEHAKKGQPLQTVRGADLAAANDALRSGKLAKRLAGDHALLHGFVNALLGDPRVAELIKKRADAIAEEERSAARSTGETEILRELKLVRHQRLAALDAEIAVVESKLLKEVQDTHAQRALTLDRELEERKEKGLAEISRSWSDRTIALETQADNLDGSCKMLRAELLALRTESETLDAQLSSLRADERDALANLDRLLTLTSAAGPQTGIASDRILVPLPILSSGTTLPLLEVNSAVASSQLLSVNGKLLMLQFLALILAGEVPSLCGPDVEDFLLIAEFLFANGASARLEGDPTIITFDDLWLRPGTNACTALGQALAIAGNTDETDQRTMLAVVQRAECSGARFWLPTLAARSRRGELPRRLLMCVTIGDESSEEAAAILANCVRLNVREILAPQAALAAVMNLDLGPKYELDPGVRPQSLVEGLPSIAPYAHLLRIVDARRAARTAVEALRIGAVPESLIELFVTESPPHATAVAAQIRSITNA